MDSGSGTDVPSYGTNSISVGMQENHNIFDMFHGFLGHFWSSSRMSMGTSGANSPLSSMFKGGLTD